MRILFSSQNKGKQNEAKELLKSLDVDLVFPDQFKEFENFEVEETGSTFAENSLLKATKYAERVNLPSIADDSGVIIDAMDGLPGIHSNRWFDGTSDQRNQEVLNRLANIADNDRTARYVTSACYYDPVSKKHTIYEETVEGKIGYEIIGDEGFDYDRIFIPNGYDKNFAQLGNKIKNSMSQRSKAFSKIKLLIEKILKKK